MKTTAEKVKAANVALNSLLSMPDAKRSRNSIFILEGQRKFPMCFIKPTPGVWGGMKAVKNNGGKVVEFNPDTMALVRTIWSADAALHDMHKLTPRHSRTLP